MYWTDLACTRQSNDYSPVVVYLAQRFFVLYLQIVPEQIAIFFYVETIPYHFGEILCSPFPYFPYKKKQLNVNNDHILQII